MVLLNFLRVRGKRNIVRTQVQTLSFPPLTTKVWEEVWREGNRHQHENCGYPLWMTGFENILKSKPTPPVLQHWDGRSLVMFGVLDVF